jgi:hypothetical protein
MEIPGLADYHIFWHKKSKSGNSRRKTGHLDAIALSSFLKRRNNYETSDIKIGCFNNHFYNVDKRIGIFFSISRLDRRKAG